MAADGGFEWVRGRPAGIWPGFAEPWLGGEYPTGRGREVQSGWQCPGCQRCYAPTVRQCTECGPKTELAASTNGCCSLNGCEDAER